MVSDPLPNNESYTSHSYAAPPPGRMGGLMKGEIDYTSHSTGSNANPRVKQPRDSFFFGSGPVDHSWRFSPALIHAFSGAAAGFASGVITCPLDVIKTKLQAQGGLAAVRQPIGGRVAGASNFHSIQRGAYKGLVGTASVIWREDGPKGFYRGLGPIIFGYLPTWAVYFTVYEKCKVVYKLDGKSRLQVETYRC